MASRYYGWETPKGPENSIPLSSYHSHSGSAAEEMAKKLWELGGRRDGSFDITVANVSFFVGESAVESFRYIVRVENKPDVSMERLEENDGVLAALRKLKESKTPKDD